MVRHDGSEDNTLGPDDCKAHSPWHRRKTQTLSCRFIGYFKRAEFWHRTGETFPIGPNHSHCHSPSHTGRNV